jgi:hypothetical protein
MSKKPKPPSRRWRIVLVRYKGVGIYLGTVEAPDADSAIEIGAIEFDYPAWRLIAEPME